MKKLLCMLLAALMVLTMASFAMAEEAASYKIAVLTGTTSQGEEEVTAATKLVETYSIIVKSDTVLSRVIDDLGLNLNYGELKDKVTVKSVNSTQVMEISVEDADPAAAQIICQKITQVCPELIKDAVEAGSVKLISAASTPVQPVSPNTLKNTAVGALLGLVACAGVLVLRMLLNNKINSDSDVEKYLELPVLGVIPVYEGDK